MVVMTIGIIVVDADVTSREIPPKMALTRGIIFPAAVSTLLTKLPISVSRSALSSAMPVIRFAHAAFCRPSATLNSRRSLFLPLSR